MSTENDNQIIIHQIAPAHEGGLAMHATLVIHDKAVEVMALLPADGTPTAEIISGESEMQATFIALLIMGDLAHRVSGLSCNTLPEVLRVIRKQRESLSAWAPTPEGRLRAWVEGR